MIIKYVRLREDREEDLSFSLNSLYHCFGVEFSTYHNTVKATIQRDSDQTPVLVDLKYFDVIDESIPDDWILRPLAIGYRLCPRVFSGDFWDLYNDGDKEAENTFAEVVKKLEDFHSQENK